MKDFCLPLVRDEDHERFIRTVGVEAIEGLEYTTITRSGVTVNWEGLHGRSSMRNCTSRSPVERDYTEHVYEVIEDNGTQLWYRDDMLHREDGPASVWSDGTQEWHRDDMLHREGGPAIVWPDGQQAWYRDDMRHREGGPAVVRSDGTEEWYRDDRLHREDGPAVIQPDGTEERWIDGKRVG